MKNLKNLIPIAALFLYVISCGQNLSETEIQSQKTTNGPESEFQKLIQTDQFRKNLAIEKDDEHAQIISGYSKTVYGDLDNDGIEDALIPFSVESRYGGNNADYHYAVYLNKKGKWIYKSELPLGGNTMDYTIEIKNIKKGVVNAVAEGQQSFQIKYRYKDNGLITVSEGLHSESSESSEKSESIDLLYFRNSKLEKIPMFGNVSDLQKILGKGSIKAPDEPMECGTYFEEGNIRYYKTSDWIYEVNDDNQAAFIQLKVKNSGITIFTEFGTIDENTTFSEITQFVKFDDMDEGEDNLTIMLFAGEDSENLIFLYFDQNDKLFLVEYHVQC